MKYVIVTKMKGVIDKVYGPYDSTDEAERNESWIKICLERKYATKAATIIRELVDPSVEI